MSTHNIGFYEDFYKQNYLLIIIKYAPYLFFCIGGILRLIFYVSTKMCFSGGCNMMMIFNFFSF